jgi:hypothetical protein
MDGVRLGGMEYTTTPRRGAFDSRDGALQLLDVRIVSTVVESGDRWRCGYSGFGVPFGERTALVSLPTFAAAVADFDKGYICSAFYAEGVPCSDNRERVCSRDGRGSIRAVVRRCILDNSHSYDLAAWRDSGSIGNSDLEASD